MVRELMQVLKELRDDRKVTIFLPANNNKLFRQRKNPYVIVNKIDYKINIDGKYKIFHAHLFLPLYVRGDVHDP